MKNKIFALFASLWVHATFVIFVYILEANKTLFHPGLHIVLVTESTSSPIQIQQNRDEIQRVSPSSRPPVFTPSENRVVNIDSLQESTYFHSDTVPLFTEDAWNRFLLKKEKEDDFLKDNPKRSLRDNNKLVFSLDDLTNPIIPGDDIDDMIKTRNQGFQPGISMQNVLSKMVQNREEKVIPPRFDFMPTEVQIRAMAHVLKSTKATQIEIYKHMDVNQPITAEGMNRSLDVLVNKGFLKRKKVSPENIFTFFGIPIEMSSLNRKNEIYEYEPKLTRNKIMDFLQARLYLLKEKRHTEPADSLHLQSQIRNLQKKIQFLLF